MKSFTRLEYPAARRSDHVDVYHGEVVADPYRWLEDLDGPETAEWVAAQNRVSRELLEALPERDEIARRLTEVWDYEKFTPPSRHGDKYVWQYNSGLQNQSVLYIADSLEDPGRVLIDPNEWSEDGTVALMAYSFNEDASLISYNVADAGSDWQEIRVRNVATGEDLPDRLGRLKFFPGAWVKDGSGFFYARYKEPEGAEFEALADGHSVWFHRLGDEQSQDTLIFEAPDHPDWLIAPSITDDGRYLLISPTVRTDLRAGLFVLDLQQPGAQPREIMPPGQIALYPFGNIGTRFFAWTLLDAPLGRVVEFDIDDPDPKNWKELIPEGKDKLEAVRLVGDRLIVSRLRDAQSGVFQHHLDGSLEFEVKLPGVGTVVGFGGNREHTETFYGFTSFTVPLEIYRYDITTGESTLYRAPQVPFDVAQFVTTQIFAGSQDGTRVPVFVTHRRDVSPDGTNACLLYGYGGFGISTTPMFAPSRLPWLERGGVLAVAVMRGGGEYGEEWHQAGTKAYKQNVFDDFIGAGEHLIKTGWAAPGKLVIQGGSNGGLLVGACVTQRPDLFAGVHCAVGVLDMLRFQHFTVGWAWTSDYGSSDDPADFEVLRAYSPLHNVRHGTEYPAILVTTADHDDRVVPSHSFKFTSELQAAQAGDAPIIARIDVRAGHGLGKPTGKLIEEQADVWAFLLDAVR